MWLFAVFMAVPLIEIALFILVGGWLTLWPTLGLVVLTAIIGSVLVRRQGLAQVQQIQQRFSALQDPTLPMAHGVLILVSGLLLITPGFFTDFLGFSLLVPWVRAALLQKVAGRVFVNRGPLRTEDIIIEGQIVDVTPSRAEPHRPPSGWTRH